MPVDTKLECTRNRLYKTELKICCTNVRKSSGKQRLLCNIPVTIKRMKWDPGGFITNKRYRRKDIAR